MTQTRLGVCEITGGATNVNVRLHMATGSRPPSFESKQGCGVKIWGFRIRVDECIQE